MPSLERTLLRAVVAFRLIALAWMAILVAVAAVRVPDISVGVMVVVLLVAALSTAVLQLAYRRGQVGPPLVVADAIIGTLVAAGPWIAGTAESFYGGYPMSSVVLVAWAAGTGPAIGLAAVMLFVVVAGAYAVGDPDVGDLVRTGLTLLLTAGVVGWVMTALRESDARRRDAEEAQARAEERARLAAQLHDSAVQTLVVLRQQADDPEQVRVLARRQERELRALMQEEPGLGGLTEGLSSVADDVEDLHGLHIERVLLGDAEAGDSVDAVVSATREALVNVAKHAGTNKAHLFAEVTADRVTVTVRDRGTGFEVGSVGEEGGLARSIRDRVTGVGGTVSLRSGSGGTEVEMEVPR